MRYPLRTLEELVSIKGGGTPSRKVESYWDGNIPWASVKDMHDSKLVETKEHISSEALHKSASKLIEANSIIVATRMGLGKVAINTKPVAINQDLKALLCKDNTHYKYIFYFLLSKARYLQSRGKGATVKGIKLNVLKQLKIPLPPLAEQRRIAAILDQADALRRNRQEALRLSETLLQSVFLELFGDPVTNPKGWEVKKLGEILSRPLQNGIYYPKEQYTKSEIEGTEMVHMADAFYDEVKRGQIKMVKAKERDIEKYSLKHSDLLIARRSVSFEGAAKACMIPESTRPLIFESSLIRLTPNTDVVIPVYLFSFLNQDRAKSKYVLPHIKKSTISGINQSSLKKVKVLIPTLQQQLEFQKIFHKKKAAKSLQQQQLAEAETLFQALMQRAFRGEL